MGVCCSLVCVLALLHVAGTMAPPAVVQTHLPPADGARPHVVVLIMDEFPGDHMIGPDGVIDAVRFPHLARLAARSHWFPNASSWSPATSGGVPAILDGLHPRGAPATRRGHPVSIYDTLGRAGYRIVDSEETTALCPRRLCARLAVRAPPCRTTNCRFIDPGRLRRFNRWLRRIRPTGKPTFWMKHLPLPHRPWIYLPSGLRTQAAGRLTAPLRGLNRLGGPSDEFVRQHNYQRHLLQLRFADRLVGRLVGRLVRGRMLDRTLLVVTSDHGYSFTGGRKQHRRLIAANAHQIAPVPLLIKLPGQRVGRRDDSYAANADVAPTIADVLDLPLGYVPDAASVFDPSARERHSIALAQRVGLSTAQFEAQRAAWNKRRLRLFGSGRRGFWDGIGPNRHLVGRRIARGARRRRGRLPAVILQPERLRRVRRASGSLPVDILGHLRGRRGRQDLALAVNRRIEAVGTSFRLPGSRGRHFALLVRPACLREGRNRVELFAVKRGDLLRLVGRV
jgi:hypothetical protein